MLKKNPTFVAIALLVVLTGVTFHGVWGHGFVELDDSNNIYRNARFVESPMRSIGVFWSDLEGYDHLWVPLTYTVWAVLAEVAALPDGVVDEKSGSEVKAAFDPTVFSRGEFVSSSGSHVALFCSAETPSRRECDDLVGRCGCGALCDTPSARGTGRVDHRNEGSPFGGLFPFRDGCLFACA